MDFPFSLQFPIIHLFTFSNKYGGNSFTILYKDIFPFWSSCDYIQALPLTDFMYPNPEFQSPVRSGRSHASKKHLAVSIYSHVFLFY